MAMLAKSLTLAKSLNPNSLKSISTFSVLNQHPLPSPDLPPPPPPSPPPSILSPPSPSPQSPTPSSSLPPNPSTGSPLYHQNWRSPLPTFSSTAVTTTAIISLHRQSPLSSLPKKTDTELMNDFADWATTQRWGEIKDVFEQWIRSLDVKGKPNRPNVGLFNLYLRAHLMLGADASELLQVVDQMVLYAVVPSTASYNLVLKTVKPNDWETAVNVLERMLQSGKESQPDHESFDLVINMLFRKNQIETALKYLDPALKSGYMLSRMVFNECIRSCVAERKIDTLEAIIEKCKASDQNKALLPNWDVCKTIAEIATQSDNSKLAFMALEFMARWIQSAEKAYPSVYLCVDEGLIIKCLSTAARTYYAPLLDASWAILKRSLREKKVPRPETYLAKINALASVGNLPSAFSTLNELETKHGNSSTAAEDHLLSPFTSLYPLVVACAGEGHETLDEVYFNLLNLSRADPPYKSVAALNCVILGCANIWDLDRAYQTFDAISSVFGLTPNIHSYNALLHTFGKLRKTEQAARTFEHLTNVGVKPNAMSYSLLVDAHLVNRDPKSALAVLQAMIEAGLKPQRPTLLKVRRRCLRELDEESNSVVESIARQCEIGLGSENRRNILFNMEYDIEEALS